MDFLNDWNMNGFLVGLASFLLIGVFHPVVKIVEYNFGKKAWPFFLFPGIGLAFLSLFLNNTFFCVITGVLAFSLFWSTHELFKQHQRVLKGQAKRNPKRNYE
jgi:hypothetical protein